MQQRLRTIERGIAHGELALRPSSGKYQKNARFARTLIIIIIIRSSVGGIMTKLKTERPGIRTPVVATDFFSEQPDRLWVPVKVPGA